MRTLQLLALVCLSTICAVDIASAETVVTLNVPIQLKNLMPQVHAVLIVCTVSDKAYVPNEYVEKEKWVFPDSAGNYSGTLAITWDRSEFPQDIQADPGLIHYYKCTMSTDAFHTAGDPAGGPSNMPLPGTAFHPTIPYTYPAKF